MTKMKKENGGFRAIKGKTKTIKLRNGESIMEGNSVQMPFIAPYRIPKNKETGLPEPLTYIEYRWTVLENGQNITRGLNVNGHGKLGVPTLKDKEVLRALQDIYIMNKIEDGILELETDESKITEEDLIIKFEKIDRIATEMGKVGSTAMRKFIKESIERLVATTMFSTHSGGIYDSISKKYITSSTQSYRYLDEMADFTVYDCENCLYDNICKGDTDNCQDEDRKRQDFTKIKMSKFMYLNIANNYRLYYLKDNTNKIKNLISKNIYMISRKWLGDGYTSRANIQKYLDRIPINSKAEKHRKQEIKDCVALLDKYDFVDAYMDGDIVVVVHKDKIPTKKIGDEKDKIPTEEDSYLRNKYNKYSEFNNELINIGFTPEELDEYIDLERFEYLKAVLRYVMLQKQYNKEIDCKAYMINCIKSNTEIDRKYYNLGKDTTI